MSKSNVSKKFFYFNRLSFLCFNKRNEFNITNIAAPVSLRTANHSVRNPGNTKIKAISLIIIAEIYILFDYIFSFVTYRDSAR